MFNLWKAFYCWYERNVEDSIGITLIILIAQIPHMIWGGDVLYGSGIIYGVNPVSDFFLYGIDLIEIPLILKTAGDFVILKRRKK